jgi:hypothetical protein
VYTCPSRQLADPQALHTVPKLHPGLGYRVKRPPTLLEWGPNRPPMGAD